MTGESATEKDPVAPTATGDVVKVRFEDPQQLLASLQKASLDSSLDTETRQLMSEAMELLQVTVAEKDWALLRYRALFDAVPYPVSVLA
jgi:hypothetical protein